MIYSSAHNQALLLGMRDPSSPLQLLIVVSTITSSSRKQRKKNVHNCPNVSFQGWTLMRTQGNLYFKDAITPKQKTIMAFMWQSLVLSVIRVHCLYSPQLRKPWVFGNLWNTACQHLVFTVVLTRSNKSDHPNSVLCLNKGKVQKTENANLLTWANNSFISSALKANYSSFTLLWFCCTFSVTCNARMIILCVSFLLAMKAY